MLYIAVLLIHVVVCIFLIIVVLLQSDEAEGKKIDFLLQEMNREINTIGSKVSDVEITRQVIEVKSELGKLREQAQNIE